MRQPSIAALSLGLLLLVQIGSAAQSLSDASRKEQQRRSSLETVEEKKIEGQDGTSLAPDGNLSRFSPVPRANNERRAVAAEKSDRRTLASVRASVQKLDREIRQTEDRLRVLRSRAEVQRKAAQRASSRSPSDDNPRQDSRWQIEELELKLARLREERASVYDSGRKAGFLPGELDGKGIIP
jgi:hypothetical protein